MVIVLRGHGDETSLFDSEGTPIPLTFLHDIVSYAQDPRFEAVPRIFIVDTCRGKKSGKVNLVFQSQGDDEKQAQDTNTKGKSVAGGKNGIYRKIRRRRGDFEMCAFSYNVYDFWPKFRRVCTKCVRNVYELFELK